MEYCIGLLFCVKTTLSEPVSADMTT